MSNCKPFVCWVLAMSAGILWLTDHSTRPGPTPDVIQAWPAGSLIQQRENACVITFLHPHCPCSLSTMRQLNQIVARGDVDTAEIDFVFVFYCPTSKNEDWIEGKLCLMAKQLGRVIVDFDGAETDRFGAKTSGHMFLFGNDELKFSGGITSGLWM